jgi:predicted DCC family thiol-disulfide oxidoreductase YuxK
MISLSSEMTDSKGRHAYRGWVFFDRDCPDCTSLARRFRRILEKRGFGLAALQDPRVTALLDLPVGEPLREMRVVTADVKFYRGAQAAMYLASNIWWAWPLYAASKLPGVPFLLDAGYRWFASHRTCVPSACLLSKGNYQNDVLGKAKGERR